jgi:hydroxymethylpyrimidine/phosphomethylpyrimidine kinase
MVAESGAELLEPSATRALVELLLPRATVITPNVLEARALAAHAAATGITEPTRADRDTAVATLARILHALGPAAVVVTGGHRERATDVFFDGTRLVEIPGERYPAGAAHGSGCTHSSVLAARLSWGDGPLEAARIAKEMASRAVRDGLEEIGAGAGPVDVLGVTSLAHGGGDRRGEAEDSSRRAETSPLT